MPAAKKGPTAPVIATYTINGGETVSLDGMAEANSTVTVYDGQTPLGTTTANASGAWSYTTGILADGTQVFTATATDSTGTSVASNAVDPIIGQTAGPAVVSVATSGTGIINGSGELVAGDVVTLTLNMSEAVTVAGGTPTLSLDDGATATYVSGSGTDALSFSYTVAAGQDTPDLTATAVDLNGATITDGAGNNANLAGTLTPTGTLQIDAPIVLSFNNLQYDPSGPWSANDAAWNAGSLVDGVDYTQSITIDNAQDFPDGTLISWVWPWTSGPGGVYSFPEIVYGSTPFLINPAVPSTQAANFENLSTSYSITLSGYTAGFDTIFDMWLTSQPNGNYTTRDYELEIVAHADWTPPASSIAYTLNDSTLQNATVYVTPDYTDGVGDYWTNITVMPSSDILAGTISISDILKSLIWNGVITGQEYLSGVEFGPEVGWGTGSLLVNSLSYQWSGTATIEGTSGNDTFTIAAPGGNDVEGNGGVDTVVYNGTYSQFQIESEGSEVLVMENNNISTLDVLNGISYIKFSDGTYDTATSTFTPAAVGQNGPVISSLVESPSSGALDAGKTVTLTLNLSEAVTVAGGTPTLTLSDGATATYSGGTGSNALTFSYTVAAGQNTADLTATTVNLNGATVTDGAGNAANLSLGGLTQSGPQIDTTAPTVSSLVESPSSGALDAGKTVTLTLNLSEAVTVAGGTPTLTLSDGATATYSGGTGSNALTFSYTVAAGQNTADLTATTVNLNGATVTDGAGNAANLSLGGLTQSGPQIDTTAPTVSSLVESPSSGALDAGKTVTLTLNLSEAVTVAGGTPTLTLSDGATATYSGGTGSNALTFSYTVAAGQNTADLTATTVNLNGATVTDGAGNAANLSLGGLTQSGPQIDTTAPTVSSLVESPSSGALDAGKTVTLTLNLSEAVTVAGGTPTLTLSDGATATYSGGTGSNALTFSYTVAAGQNTADLTATTVNLNGATVTDGAGNAANLSLGGLTQSGPQIDTTAPTVSSLVESPSSGALDAGKTVTLTLNLSEAVTVAGGTPTLTLSDGATATYSGGTGSNALTFSYTVAAGQNTADLTATTVNLNGATVTDGAGNAANLSLGGLTQSGPQIDTTAPTVSSLVESPSSGALDAGKTVTLTLNLSEAVTVAGGTPTLTLSDGATATYSGGTGSNALTFSYTVAAGQNTADLTATTVNLNGATVTDGAGNAANLSLGGLTQSGPQIDTTAPAAPVITSDTVNGNNTVTLSGTAEANSAVTVYDNQTALGTTAANASGAWTYTTGTLANGTQVFSATAMDAAGNVSGASNAVDPSIGELTELTGAQAGTLSVANGTTIYISGTVDNTGTIALHASGNGADLAVVGSATLTGVGSVTLSDNAGNEITSNGVSATLTNANNMISGAGTIGDNLLTLNNQGTIDGNDSLALVVDTGSNTITNSGLLEGTSSGGLVIDSNVSNSKAIEAVGTNAKVVVQSNITNTTKGLVLASGSGAQVDLDNATIVGGTLQTSGGSAVIETVSGSSDVLDGGTVSPGSTVEINSGTVLTIEGKVANSGTLLANGTLDVDGTLAGGTTEIGGTGEVVLAQASTENVSFQAKATGELVLDQATNYNGQISGFSTTQSIDLTDINFAAGVKISYASNNRQNTGGVLTISEGNQTVRLELEGSYTLANFRVASDGAGGTLLTDPAVVTQGFGSAPATIGNNTVLEVNTPDKGNVTFTGTTGTLWLDQPATFTGKVSGFGAQNLIDLPSIAFSQQTTLGYSPNNNNTGGTLAISEGPQHASIALLGSYMASSFVLESDNHGGTMVVTEAAQVANQSLLAIPQHG